MKIEGPIKLRPSRLGLLSLCPQALSAEGQVEISTDSEPAAIGRAVHQAAAHIVRTNLDGRPDVSDYCREEGISHKEDEVGWLSWEASQWWKDLRGFFTDEPEVETLMRTDPGHKDHHFIWRGTADVMDVVRGDHKAFILDWKTGRKTDERLHLPQMKGYAFLLFESIEWDAAVDEVSVMLVWLRDKSVTHLVFTAQEIRDWAHGFMESLLSWPDDRYAPSEECAFCKRASCPGRDTIMSSAVAVLTSSPSDLGERRESGYPTEPAQLIRAFQQWKVLQKMGEGFEKQFRVDLKRFGKLEANGITVTMKETAGGTKIDAAKAVDVLRLVGLSEDELWALASITKKDTMKAVRRQASRGWKEKTENAVLGMMGAAGAVSKGAPRHQIEIRKEQAIEGGV